MSSTIITIFSTAKEKVNNAREALHRDVLSKGSQIKANVENVLHVGASGDQTVLSEDTARRDMAESIFGDSIDYDRVLINDSSATADANQYLPGNSKSRPYVLGNTINYSGTIPDDTFIHEMMHIYQYQNEGWSYLPKAGIPAATGDYDYAPSDLVRISEDESLTGQRLQQFNYEQQAEIVRDYFRLTTLEKGGSVTLTTGEVVDYSQKDHYQELYTPYIQEIQNSKPISDGIHYEINETGEEVIREFGETGEEVSREFLEGSKTGVVREFAEGTAEISREFAEGSLEIGREAAEKATQKVTDTAESVGNAKDNAQDWISDKIWG